MAHIRSQSTYSPIYILLAFLWLCGAVVVLAGASAITNYYSMNNMGGGTAWFIIALDWATLIAFVVLFAQGRLALYRVALTSMLLIVTVFFIGYASLPTGVNNSYNTYVAGLIISLIVNFAVLLILGVEPVPFATPNDSIKMHSHNNVAPVTTGTAGYNSENTTNGTAGYNTNANTTTVTGANATPIGHHNHNNNVAGVNNNIAAADRV